MNYHEDGHLLSSLYINLSLFMIFTTGELGYSRNSKSKVTKGLHNWLQFLTERIAGRLTYLPPPVAKDVFTEVICLHPYLPLQEAILSLAADQ